MKLQYQLNLFAIAVLLAVVLAVAWAGVGAIGRVAMELNGKLLENEMKNVMAEVHEAHTVLRDNRLNGVQSYIRRAQQDLLREFSQFRFGQTGKFFVINTETGNDLLGHRELGDFIDADCMEKMLVSTSGGQMTSGTGTNTRYLLNFAQYPEWQWLLVIAVAEKEIMEARDTFLWQVFGIILASLGAGIVLLIWFNGRVVKPIRQLSVAAQNISKGKWDVPLPKVRGESEIAQLTEIFRTMSESLGDMYEELSHNLDHIEKSRQEARQSSEKFRSLVETTSDLVWEIDRNGHYTYVSPQVTKILGYQPQELLGKSPENFSDPEMYHVDKERLATLLKEDDSFVGVERNIVTKFGEIVTMESSGMVFFDKEGNRAGFRGIDRDITRRKKAAKNQQSLQGQLIQAQKMEAVGRLAGGVAHDFNNMLSVIIGHAEMALEQMEPDNKYYFFLHEIHKAGKRSAKLTRHLLTFARKQTIELKVIDLNETVDGMTSMLKRLIGEDIDLAWVPGEDLWPVKMDPSQVDQILANLCVNGRDAILGVGKITVETFNVVFDDEYCRVHVGSNPGEYVCLAVSDNGYGMSPEVVSHIFEPFFTTKESGKGTGLGLSTVYGIIQQNKGFITVYSEQDKGTTFKLYFRHHVDDEVRADEVVVEQSAPGGAETILLVEDEMAILRMTSRMLGERGYQVIEAKTPGEAIAAAKEHEGHIHLLLTDVIMPEMNGRDLAQRITADYPEIQCLYMSGYTANVIARHGVLEDGVNFLAKPFSLEALSNKVRNVLDHKTLS